MKNTSHTTSAKFILVASIALASSLGGNLEAAPATALVDNAGTLQFLNFDTASPGVVGAAVTLSGLGAGETLVGIDYRLIDGLFVGFGYATATGASNVYSINPATGAAVSIKSLTLGTGLARITMDFNPTANALRLVTSGATSNNLRIGTGGTGTVFTDTDLNPANSGIRATAYSRNNAGGGTSGATTLYEIDGTNNALVSQGSIDFFTGFGTSPNTGTLTSVATLSGVGGNTVVGFDIFNATGTAAASQGLAFVATGAGSFLSLNLVTGAASGGVPIGGTYTSVRDIAVVPEPGSLALLGLAGAALAARRKRRQSAAV